ncbi:MAG TPA: PIN domain-containing protein [Micromonosporaceae bacterium]|nr:PIN domain-containing protein [Micromonosporaceae bacterium]
MAAVSRGILDTSVLVADDIIPIPGELAISIVSIAELKFGVLVAKNDETRATRLSRLSAIERRFDPLPVDEAVADSYARLAARVVAVGRQPRARTMDLLIAATAHAHDATIYTRNAKGLAGIEDLVMIASI